MRSALWPCGKGKAFVLRRRAVGARGPVVGGVPERKVARVWAGHSFQRTERGGRGPDVARERY